MKDLLWSSFEEDVFRRLDWEGIKEMGLLDDKQFNNNVFFSVKYVDDKTSKLTRLVTLTVEKVFCL